MKTKLFTSLIAIILIAESEMARLMGEISWCCIRIFKMDLEHRFRNESLLIDKSKIVVPW